VSGWESKQLIKGSQRIGGGTGGGGDKKNRNEKSGKKER